MWISKRLQTLANLVTSGHRLADVGCDHGYIPIYLIQNAGIPKAIAMDVGKGPLARARENIEAYGLSDYIETRLSDGLAGLRAGEVDTVLISGMGGPLMERILMEGKEVLVSNPELILQPQSDIPHFRHFLGELNYEIVQEDMVEEDGKYYPMMKARKGNASYKPLEERYGPLLLKNHHPVLKQYLLKECATMEEIVKNLQIQSGESAIQRLKELEVELQLPKEALRQYETE